MKLRVATAVLGVAATLCMAGWASAAEPPGKRGAGGIPKGSYTQTCTCQFSGGVELACFCANINARWFRTVMDVRQCPAPSDIKNCEGVLTCTENAGAQCPASRPAAAAVKK